MDPIKALEEEGEDEEQRSNDARIQRWMRERLDPECSEKFAGATFHEEPPILEGVFNRLATPDVVTALRVTCSASHAMLTTVIGFTRRQCQRFQELMLVIANHFEAVRCPLLWLR